MSSFSLVVCGWGGLSTLLIFFTFHRRIVEAERESLVKAELFGCFIVFVRLYPITK